MDSKPDLVFECSWEVCNKVGGIYTVVRSKALQMISQYGDSYVLVGPYFAAKAQGEFVEEAAPLDFKVAFDALREQGIGCHYGTWMIPGKPKTVLVDFSVFASSKDQIKKDLWNSYKVDSLGSQYFDFDEPVVWSTAVGKLIEKLCAPNKRVVAHFHEWLSGAGLLWLKMQHANAATVFTTHATILGRSIASSGDQLYERLSEFNPEEKARSFGIQAKFLLERAAANNAEIFTTVSEITAIEAKTLLGREPEVLLLNGLDIALFPSFEQATAKHMLFKRKIKEFLIAYFFPYYKFSLDNTFLYFIAGRHELRDKGVDVYLKSLAKLNESLKQEKSERTVVAFVWVDGYVQSVRQDLLENLAKFKDIKDEFMDESETAKQRMFYDFVLEHPLDGKRILGDQSFFSLQKKLLAFKKAGIPPLCTHHMHDEGGDDILHLIRELGLNNSAEDRVKIIYYPIFLSGSDRLLDLSYYEGITGCHLGVFPSYYEPWGYTPLETAALGVSAVTTDLAGFGRFIKPFKKVDEPPGIHVLSRLGQPDEVVANELFNIMHDFAVSSTTQRTHSCLEARRLASLCDWSFLVRNYVSAHQKALQKLSK